MCIRDRSTASAAQYLLAQECACSTFYRSGRLVRVPSGHLSKQHRIVPALRGWDLGEVALAPDGTLHTHTKVRFRRHKFFRGIEESHFPVLVHSLSASSFAGSGGKARLVNDVRGPGQSWDGDYCRVVLQLQFVPAEGLMTGRHPGETFNDWLAGAVTHYCAS